MSVLERWRHISNMVENEDYVTVEEFCTRLGVSEATIRRDLTAMEGRGMLERFRGGAQKVKAIYIPEHSAGEISHRLMERRDEKIKIARRAAEMIGDGDYVFIDSSSTTYFMIDFIMAKDVTILTNSILIMPKLLEKNMRGYITGGFIDKCSESAIPDDYTVAMQSMNFNKTFIGTYGISEKTGYTTYGTAEGNFKRNIIAQSEQTFVLADMSKFDRSAFFSYASLDACTLITDGRNRITDNMEKVIIC